MVNAGCSSTSRSLRLSAVALLFAAALLQLTPAVRAADLGSTVAISVPAGDLDTALRALAEQTYLQVSFLPQDVEGLRTPGLSGRYSARAALAALLKGTHLEILEQDNHSVVIRRVPAAEKTRVAQSPLTADAVGPLNPLGDANVGLEEVVVTARKQAENVMSVPESITAFDRTTLEQLNVKSFADYATKVPNLSFSYGTNDVGYGDSRSVAIRGVSGPNTVGIYLDDTPIPDSIDPRIIDIDRIEVLKGPQGTLFGEGSLGGNLRMITVQPSATDSDMRVAAHFGLTSGAAEPDYGAEFAGNLNLIDSVLTARVVGFADRAGGYLTRTYPSASGSLVDVRNQGALNTYGGSVSLLWNIAERLSVTARVLYQYSNNYGWAAPYAPLPAFEVTSLVLNRATNVQEGSSDRWYLPSLQVNYDGEGFSIHSSTSYFDRKVLDLEDGTEGTGWILSNYYGFDVPSTQPIPWSNTAVQRRAAQETRIAFDKHAGFSGVAGIYIARDYQDSIANGGDVPGIAAAGLTSFAGYCPSSPQCPSYNSNLTWYSAYPLDKQDAALFGEMYYEWRGLELTLGLRAFEDRQHFQPLAEGALNGAFSHYDLPSSRQEGVTPKVALSYKVTPSNMYYVSASKGFRAGGENQPVPDFCGLLSNLDITPGVPSTYRSDTVWSYEIGNKAEVLDKRLQITTALYQMNWSNIQQSISLPNCFLFVTANQGAARARGGELELTAKPSSNFDVRAAIGFDDARITEQGAPGLPPVGARVAQIPELTGSASGTYSRALREGYVGFLSADFSYVGNSPSNTSSLGYPLVRPAYDLVNASVGLRHGKTELSLYGSNLTNARPNLGDINPISYVRHDGDGPDAPIIPRVGTLQPLTVGVQFRQRF